MVLDLSPDKKDIITDVVEAISKVYRGIKAP